jgi:L-ascorbate metabolism protein UlaG (beta-lactamase superfamily)
VRWLKRILITLLALVVVLVLVGTAFGWMLSAEVSGQRAKRIAASPNFRDGKFHNAQPAAPTEVEWDSLDQWLFGKEQRVPPAPIPVVTVDTNRLARKSEPGLRVIWLGHSSVLIEIDGYRVLTDPVVSDRASPFSAIGPKRFHPSPIPLAALTGIDAVVHSHSHYDHLDEATTKRLAQEGTQFYVGLGVGSHLQQWGVAATQINEMDWWESLQLGELTITATPARHYSGRGLFDYQQTLWSSWSISGPKHRFFFSGDSGYSQQFAEIGQRLGPFDLTIIKAGSYGPGQAWIDIHMRPEESALVHTDVRGRVWLPVHWATFNLAYHDWDEPIKRTLAAAKKHNIRLVTPRVGMLVDIINPAANEAWWETVGP